MMNLMSQTIDNIELKTVIPVLAVMLFFIQGAIYATSPLLIKIAEDIEITLT